MDKIIPVYIVLLFLTIGRITAQSDTYRIEEGLSVPTKAMTLVSPNKLFETVDKDFLTLSVVDEIADLGNRPLITGYLQAYQNHYPITISPDIFWVLISQGFSHHINNNSEELRTMLVDFDGKKELTVVRDMRDHPDFSEFPWASIFPEFVEQISSFTGKALMDQLTPDFTTTTPASRIAGQITIMESMKKFFKYKVTMTGCGIPEVTIEGTVADWENILTRLDFLSKYKLDWWTTELKPIIHKIIETKKGNMDTQFWMNMIKYHKTGFYGSYDGIDGWLLKFYPYKMNGNRNNFKEIKHITDLPEEISNVPFIFEAKDLAGNVVFDSTMEFWSGFMGIIQDKGTFRIKPEIGWAVNRPSKNRSEKENSGFKFTNPPAIHNAEKPIFKVPKK